MEKKDLIPRGDAISHLESSALHPKRRDEMIERALQELLTCLPAAGTALVWPCQNRNTPWKLYYAGYHSESMQCWLADRLHFSLDATFGVLQQDLSKLSDMPFPHLIGLQPASMFPAGLWIIWTPFSSLSGPINDYVQEVRQTLEALIEVESSEAYYFSNTSPLSDQALIEALGQGDSHGLLVLLSFTRLIGKTEVVCWGRAYQDVIEATDQLGAKRGGFGFAIPRGQGVHGRILTSGSQVADVDDYRNSQYRHSSVCDIVDSEQVRSSLVLPVHTRIERQERSEQITGFLYATRRTVKPFSLAERLLMQRMASLLEPLPLPTRPSSYSLLGVSPISDQKAGWYKLVLHANHIESLEAWVGRFVKGTMVVTNSNGQPYVFARREQLERLQTANASSMDGVQVISLSAPGISLPGRIYLRSDIALPPSQWPDFFADLVVTCNQIIRRMEEVQTPRLESPIQYHSLFLSYSDHDKVFIKRLHNDLTKQGVRCWFAPHDLKPGTPWTRGIEEAIHLHDKLLLVLSKNALASNWVQQEVETALHNEATTGREILFPIRLDNTVLESETLWAKRLRRHHIGDFTDWQDEAAYNQALTTLLQHLKVAKPPTV